jgi:uncharacterized membrane protein (UPF0127 family)
MRRFFLALSLFILASLAQAQELQKNEITIFNKHGEKYQFIVDVAESEEDKARGLMYRKTLNVNSGMLFLHQRESSQLMWMKNTLIPLDMLFIDKTGKITRIVERTIPRSLNTISSRGKVLAVLELRGGTVSKLGIKTGDKVKHSAFK